jgi:hypothetical protein
MTGHRDDSPDRGHAHEFCRVHEGVTEEVRHAGAIIAGVAAKVDKIDDKIDQLALASTQSATERWWLKWTIYIGGTVFAAVMGTMLSLLILYAGDTRSLVTIVASLQETDRESKADRKALHQAIEQQRKEMSGEISQIREKMGTFQTKK